jgi:hypothetical protein
MSALVRIAARASIIGIGIWLIGGPALRVGGAASMTVELLLAADTGSIASFLIATLGLAWLAGHWLFAARNHYYRSPLARRRLPRRAPTLLRPPREIGACRPFRASSGDDPHRLVDASVSPADYWEG